MKIVAIADTHGRHKKLSKKFKNNMPKGDVLICAGDVTPNGELEMMSSFLNWIIKQHYEHKIFIAGNHDRCLENNNRCLAMDMIKDFSQRTDGNRYGQTHYLEDKAIRIGGVKFYGSPWQPEFMNWSFNLPRGEDLLEKWKMIPSDTDVLITHSPPHKILDVSVYDKVYCGCEDLRDEIFNRIKPQVHVFGHIHAWHGIEEHEGIKFVNASSVNEAYIVQNDPIVVEVEDNGNLIVESC